jgi:nucleoside-diphosphate-sugar epimerase
VEQLIVRSTAVNGIVVRPALLYGRAASILAALFEKAAQGRVVWPGTPGGRYALIHPDDLSDLYVRLAEKASLMGGKIFDAANPNTESVDELLQKLVQISGASGYEYREPKDGHGYTRGYLQAYPYPYPQKPYPCTGRV